MRYDLRKTEFSSVFHVYITLLKKLWRMCKTLITPVFLPLRKDLAKDLRNNISPEKRGLCREKSGKRGPWKAVVWPLAAHRRGKESKERP